MYRITAALVLVTLVLGCKTDKQQGNALFVLRNNKDLGINFRNDLTDTNEFNVYKYRNYYNGGGVGIGDINNDGLPDIYFVSNQGTNKLYLNKGGWKFEDITEKSGTGGKKAWSTGVAMADINADGLLDIYVCNSGDIKGDNKENELFINNGDLTFTEAAAQFGLNDPGFSTHASFFDYDKDGDLDAYILNNSFQAIGSFNLRKNERPVRDKLGGDKLLQNQDGKFVDVSEKAGIYGSVIGFGLGITVGDVNNDGWEDIYISNDFFERDYLYINQQNGTFRESLTEMIQCTSAASMGADIADIDNDGHEDIFVTDMLPSDYKRLKSVTTFDDWDRYMYGVNNGYHHQFTRNTLQHNNGDGTFSETGRYSGVDASDWSWGALFFDMDNDGLKDLFVANGIYRDLTDQDYLQYVANESVMKSIISDKGVDYKKLIEIIPSNPIPNHAYRNQGELNFRPFAESGLTDPPGFSNGSAYGDLDNDGDLDLVVNNVNMEAFVYENNASQQLKNSYLKVSLKGKGKNKNAIGTVIRATDENGKSFWYEHQPVRGFESTMDSRINIGLGQAKKVDLTIRWPSGEETVMKGVVTNQQIQIDQNTASVTAVQPEKPNVPLLEKVSGILDFTHRENNYTDFNRERLVYHMMSTRGPVVARGDVNGDGIEDLVLPGPKGTATAVYTGTKDGKFLPHPVSPVFEKISEAEHNRAHLFDADGDGDNDLYLASGGTELSEYSDYLYDELLFNDGKGNFTSSGQKLPGKDLRISTGAVASADIDGDGDLDLFVGERVKIGQYGAPCSGYLLANDGKGQFTDISAVAAPSLTNIGMITDALFMDMDGDGKADLVLTGEFMDVTVLKNEKGKFVATGVPNNIPGWWNTVKTADIDNDGDQDLILGNHGLNSRFKADEKHPIALYFKDFDDNGSPEGILTNVHDDGKAYPYALRHNLMMRLPALKKKYPDFKSFKDQSINDIFTPEQLKSSHVIMATEMRSLILVNEGNMKFSVRLLPYTVQMSPVYAIAAGDLNGDGFSDLVMGGNLNGVQPEMGRYDASYGNVLINDGKGNFNDESQRYGFSVTGEIRDIIIHGGGVTIFRNNNSAVTYKPVGK